MRVFIDTNLWTYRFDQRGLKVPDAIILATAHCHDLMLATRNVRDFPPESGLVICPYQLG